jgi:hypothetical protein
VTTEDTCTRSPAERAPGWANAAAYGKVNGLVWAPSVAPDYLDDPAVPGNTTPTLDRDNGAAHDRQWSNALGTATGGPPSWVSITSFDEWHEGSTIEPASATPPAGYGATSPIPARTALTGAASETAYLDRTRHRVEQFNPAPTSSVNSPPGTGQQLIGG